MRVRVICRVDLTVALGVALRLKLCLTFGIGVALCVTFGVTLGVRAE